MPNPSGPSGTPGGRVGGICPLSRPLYSTPVEAERFRRPIFGTTVSPTGAVPDGVRCTTAVGGTARRFPPLWPGCNPSSGAPRRNLVIHGAAQQTAPGLKENHGESESIVWCGLGAGGGGPASGRGVLGLRLRERPHQPGKQLQSASGRIRRGTPGGGDRVLWLPGRRPRRRVHGGLEGDSGKGQGHKERTPLTALFVTFDAIRVYPACEDSRASARTTAARTPRSAAAWYGLLDEEDGRRPGSQARTRRRVRVPGVSHRTPGDGERGRAGQHVDHRVGHARDSHG